LCGRKTLLNSLDARPACKNWWQPDRMRHWPRLGALLDRPFVISTVDQTAHWHDRLARNPPTRLVFVDESVANTKRTRFCGRSPVGKRLAAHAPHGHYQTTTMVRAIRLSGPSAPWLFEGAMDGEMFLA
jgi:hypothetical protein